MAVSIALADTILDDAAKLAIRATNVKNTPPAITVGSDNEKQLVTIINEMAGIPQVVNKILSDASYLNPSSIAIATGMLTGLQDAIRNYDATVSTIDAAWSAQTGRSMVKAQRECGWKDPGACLQTLGGWVVTGLVIYFGGKLLFNYMTKK